MRMDQLPTPCYVIDEKKLKENLEILGDVREKAGCKILLAQKAFSCFYEYPLIGQYLDGTTASGLYEARLGKEEMGKENHVFAPAYKDADIKELGEQLGELQRVSWERYATILSLIPLPSFAAIKTQSQEKAWDCASTRSVPLRGSMPFMIPVLLVQDLALQKRYLTVRLQQSRSFLRLWTACIFIRFASRMQMIWQKHWKRWKKSSAHGFLR